jgi:hypothetical protein
MLTTIIYIRGTNGAVPNPPVTDTKTQTINGTGSFTLSLEYLGTGFNRLLIGNDNFSSEGVIFDSSSTSLNR